MRLGERRKWSREELDTLTREFRRHRHPPTFADIRRIQNVCPSLKARSLAQIKTRAWILVQKTKQPSKRNLLHYTILIWLMNCQLLLEVMSILN